MRVFVQSRTCRRGYQWVEVLTDGRNAPADDWAPISRYKDFIGLIDSDGPSLMLGRTPDHRNRYVLLVTRLRSKRLVAGGDERVTTNLLVIWPEGELANAQVLLAEAIDCDNDEDLFARRFESRIEGTVKEDGDGTFSVSKSIFKEMGKLVEDKRLPKANFSASPFSESRVARNIAARRRELAQDLRTSLLPDRDSKGAAAFVVITGLKKPESAIHLGSVATLTNLVTNEDWKPSHALSMKVQGKNDEPTQTEHQIGGRQTELDNIARVATRVKQTVIGIGKVVHRLLPGSTSNVSRQSQFDRDRQARKRGQRKGGRGSGRGSSK